MKREIFAILGKKKIYKKFRFDSNVKQNKGKNNPLKINSKAGEWLWLFNFKLKTIASGYLVTIFVYIVFCVFILVLFFYSLIPVY